MTVLAVRSLSKSFGGVHAVNEASFDVGAGEFLAMIGPNGAGKSTCFNMINGQLAPDAGEILLDGENIAGLAPRAVWRRGASPAIFSPSSRISPASGASWPLKIGRASCRERV